MKRIQYFLITLFVLLFHCHTAIADDIVKVFTDDITIPSLPDKNIYIDIPIVIESSEDITSFQCDLYLPQDIIFSTVREGALYSPSHRWTKQSKNEYTRIMCYSPTKETFTARNGEILVLRILALASIAKGTHTIYLRNIYFSDAGKPAGGYEVEDKEITVTVEKKKLIESISLIGTDIRPSESFPLQVTISPENADNKRLKWESSNTAVVTVNQNGVVTGVSEGSATITAKATDYSDVSASCIVTVNDYISFSDANVETLCLTNWDKNKDGRLSLSEAKAVTDIGTTFRGKGLITSFEEFRYFTGVKTLKADAFYNCTNLHSIILPTSLTTIGNYALGGCPNLSSIIIPEYVTSIGESVLSGCSGLKQIVVEEGNPVYDSRGDCNALIKTSTNYLIRGCENTIIPNTIETIGKNAFSNVTRLTSILIPNSVKTIESGAFYWCDNVETLWIPSSVTSIASDAFFHCSSVLQTILVEEGNPVFDSRNDCNALMNTSTNTLLLGCGKTVIPSSCMVISASAFNGCTTLRSIEIPESVQTISSAAFYGCTNLTHVVLHESLTTIGTNAFKECLNLKAISIPNTVTLIDEGTFSGCTSLQDVRIGTDVSSVHKKSFTDCNITHLEINSQNLSGTSYTSTQNMGTYFGVNIEEIVLGENVTSVGNYAFYGLKNLETIEFSHNIASIGKASFKGCSSLQSLTLPTALNSIGSEAFYNCSALTIVRSLLENPFQLTEDVFQNNSVSGNNRILYVPYNCLSKYKVKSNWNKFSQIIAGDDEEDYGLWFNIEWRYDKKGHILFLRGDGTLPVSLYSTDCSWYYYINDISTIKVGEGITSIGKVLASIPMTNIELPTSLSSIGSEAFMNNKTLNEIILPEGINSIGGYAFKGCSNLKTISIPNTVKSIGAWAFGQCESLKTIVLPESLKTIEDNTFVGCTSLTSIIIPNTVTSIQGEAFEGCTNLESISLPASLTSIGFEAFSHCSNLQSIQIPSLVTSIGQSAFSYCTSLSTVSWGEALQSMGNLAFDNCTSLTRVVSDREYPVSISKSSRVFDECSNMILYVPYGCRDNYLYSTGYNVFDEICEIEPDNYLFIPDAEANGRKVKIPVVMRNIDSITGFQFDIELPNGFTVALDNNTDDYMFVLTKRAHRNHTVASRLVNKGIYRAVISSMQNNVFVGNDGVVVNITLSVANNVADGEYEIYISNVKLNTQENITITPNGNVSKLILKNATKGDVNSDGSINVTDVGMVVGYILENVPSNFLEAAADVNSDGDINVTDVGLIIDIILSDPASAKKRGTVNKVDMLDPQ